MSHPNSTLKKDLKMGRINENKFKEFMEKKEDCKLKRFKDKYCELDFRVDNRLLELKSRNNKLKTYPDTMIGYNKIKKARKKIKKGFNVEFYFLFQDGLYKWNFVDNQFTKRLGGRNSWGEFENKLYAYIDIKNLELVSEEINSYW